MRTLNRSAKPDYACHVLSAGSSLSFLCPTDYDRFKHYAFSAVESANALRTVEFMRRYGHKVYIHGSYVYRDVAYGLNRIGVEQNISFAAECAYFGDRLYSPDFVVCKHYGYE